LVESTSFESSYLLDLKQKLTYDNKETPGEIIKRFARILKYMDSNLNILAAVVLNSLLMFNLHLLLAVEKWKSRYRDLLPAWFEVIGEFDAASGLANYSYNNPEYIYPEPVFDNFETIAGDLGHPLIPKESRVLNSFEIKGWNQFYIITGANMSGKSTFLRTIGTNYILAMIGAPVVAKKFTFYPIQLHSSIRTNDSLTKKESYFYAELKRLKQIIVELEKGEQQLILLDEILKGTNSKDKQTGSIALIKQLLKYNSVGLFATHDLALGVLETHFPLNVKNLCFEIEIQGDQMIIDYKLHKGICKNLNATFLMKNMGILIDKKE
jgi:DNA mismatch repair ATPase MutS